MNDKIDPGQGYRILKAGEVLLATDEVYRGRWDRTAFPGEKVGEPGRGTCGLYRRKVEQPLPDPGIGWRLLRPFEVAEAGDEFTKDGHTWSAEYLVGMQLGATFDLNPNSPGWYPRRRKLSAVGDGWRKLVCGEVIRPGDEIYTIEGWVPVHGSRCGPIDFASRASYRRRVPEEERACYDAYKRSVTYAPGTSIVVGYDEDEDTFRAGWLARAEWDRQEVPI